MAGAMGRGKSTRLLLSAVVVTSSIVGAWWVLDSSKATQSYLITMQDLATGSPVVDSNLGSIELSLFSIGDRYLKVGELPTGAYLSRTVLAGEAIPRSAITTQLLDDWSNLVITPSFELSSAIGPGSKVSVWSSPALDYQSYGEPAIAAVDVEVVEIRKPTSGFTQAQNSVELRVPIEALQSLIRSISNGDAIALTATGTSIAD